MKTINIFYLLLGIIIIAGGIFIYTKQQNTTEPQYVAEELVTQEDIKGCYVATLAKDVYSLNILSQEDGKVSGTLVFDNFEKDSSSGTFEGEYKDGILLGEYDFFSEGMESLMQVIFKKTENGFQRGFGPVDEETGTRFTDLEQITFDNQYEFIKTNEPCAKPWERPR